MAIRRATRTLSGAGMMAAMVCETRRCQGRGASGSSCHFVGRHPRACNRHPGDGPAHHDVVGRYYDPQTGQFLSVDPEVEQTEQAFIYVGDDPLNAIDPSGLGCGWNPFCYIGSAYDKVHKAVHAAEQWICGVDRYAIVCAQPGTSTKVPVGSIVWDTSGLPPLRLLHPQSTLESSSSYDYWMRQPTSDILHSLLPEQDGSLLAKPDGTVLDGNTRVSILKGRGVNVDSLPREVYDPSADFPLGEDGFDFGGE